MSSGKPYCKCIFLVISLTDIILSSKSSIPTSPLCSFSNSFLSIAETFLNVFISPYLFTLMVDFVSVIMYLLTCVIEALSVIFFPLISTITSPLLMPALSAGAPFAISTIFIPSFFSNPRASTSQGSISSTEMPQKPLDIFLPFLICGKTSSIVFCEIAKFNPCEFPYPQVFTPIT